MTTTRALGPLLLESLRAFESAVRLRSFKAAADELAVTPAAISQRMGTLEQRLGRALFVRGNRSLQPTTDAILLAEAAGQAFKTLDQALIIFLAANARADDSVVISVPTSFAVQWLGHRLHKFREAHPNLNIRVDASDHMTPLGQDSQFDLVVRYTQARPQGVDVRAIDEPGALIPVVNAVMSVSDEARARLLQTERAGMGPSPPTTDWAEWKLHHPALHLPKVEKITFSNTHLAIAEAKSRGGVALAPSLLVVDDLARAEMRLTNYPDMPDRMRFWIVVNRPLDERRSVHLLADWLMLEAKHHLRVLKRPD